jgi:FdhD protein
MDESLSIRSFALQPKDSMKRFRVERISDKGREEEETFIIAERPVTLFLNDQEVVTLLVTPENLKELAVGFMLSEGWLREDKPLDRIEVDPRGDVRVRVKYRNPLTEKLFLRRTITSGCGRGTIFYNVLDSLGAKKIRSSAKISQEKVLHLMQELNRRSVLYRKSGSVHGAALAERHGILFLCEDIGRHNAVDKVLGAAFLQGFSLAGKILLISGRVSSEILVKAIKRRIPFLFSYSGPTDLAVDMARQMGITLIGYVRGNSMRVYSHGERVQP